MVFQWVAASKLIAGSSVLAGIGARRALWPFMAVGSAFSAAGWFGTFELTFSFTKVIMPVPVKQETNARLAGVCIIPVVLAGAGAGGWFTQPSMEAAPSSMSSASSWAGFARSVPIRHWGMVGVGSAVVSAVSCRVVQYRGGA